MKRLFILLTLAGSLPLAAILPPLAQDLREIKTFTQDPEFYQLVGSGDSIERIEKTEGGYLVTTNHKQVLVTVTYKPVKGRLGPSPFTLSYSLAQ